MISDIDTIIFDLDGTLYEDRRVYDRYAEELARFLPAEQQTTFATDWQRAKRGDGPARVGMGYDLSRDLLFRYRGREITTYVDWRGSEQAPPEPSGRRTESTPEEPPVEVPIFGPERLNIGDWWALPDILAAHHGVAREQRQEAFLATRCAMETSLRLEADPWLAEMLDRLSRRMRLLALSNSPRDTVDDVIGQLGIGWYFAEIVTDSAKPAGLAARLRDEAYPDGILSVGDNFVNDIEPALRAGAWALSIDRHGTGLGADCERCVLVGSREEMREWLLRLAE